MTYKLPPPEVGWMVTAANSIQHVIITGIEPYSDEWLITSYAHQYRISKSTWGTAVKPVPTEGMLWQGIHEARKLGAWDVHMWLERFTKNGWDECGTKYGPLASTGSIDTTTLTCQCSMNLLMREGCGCGAIVKYKPLI